MYRETLHQTDPESGRKHIRCHITCPSASRKAEPKDLNLVLTEATELLAITFISIASKSQMQGNGQFTSTKLGTKRVHRCVFHHTAVQNKLPHLWNPASVNGTQRQSQRTAFRNALIPLSATQQVGMKYYNMKFVSTAILIRRGRQSGSMKIKIASLQKRQHRKRGS